MVMVYHVIQETAWLAHDEMGRAPNRLRAGYDMVQRILAELPEHAMLHRDGQHYVIAEAGVLQVEVDNDVAADYFRVDAV